MVRESKERLYSQIVEKNKCNSLLSAPNTHLSKLYSWRLFADRLVLRFIVMAGSGY